MKIPKKPITFVMPEEVETRFRKAVGKKFGSEKGSLGKALTEAARLWMEKN